MTSTDSHADVVAFLADPATHGLGPGAVRHIRTHISDVFLAGDLAYKIKRPVAYAFVDFTTLAARRAACEAELALNRRTTPEIYLRLAAVRRDETGRLGLDRAEAPAAGTPVEWAVVLARFDETATFDRLAERGAIEGRHIDAIVDAAVALHAAAAPARPRFGGQAALARVVAENAADMARLPALFAPERAAALTSAFHAALKRIGPVLDRRRDQGFVRRCHGDLHLANIVLWRGRPVPFDCIEFSDDIANVDVGYDFAFLLMDLEARGLRAFANRALARYVGRTGDTGFLAALAPMMALRALVRAKVTAMAVTGDAHAPENADLRTRVAELTALAETLLAPSGPPHLIAVGGLSGTGKSTLAARLAPAVGRAPGALLVRSDVIRKRQAGVAPEQRLPAAAYNAESNRRVYETLRAEAAAALAAGMNAVVDAVFARVAERTEIEAVARAAGARFDGLWLAAPAAVLLARVAARDRDASDATQAVVALQLAYDTGDIPWRRVDAAGAPEQALAQALAGLGL